MGSNIVATSAWAESGLKNLPAAGGGGEGDRSAVRLSGGGASAGFAQAKDAVGDRLGIGQDVSCGHANDLEPERGHVGISLLISRLSMIVSSSVDLDHEFRGRTVEVSNVRSDRMLLAEAEFAWS